MTDETKFKARTPRTREEALAYIEKLCTFYDIQLEEDALLDAIHTMEQKHNEQLQAMWLQVVGTTLDVTGKEFLTVDTAQLLDQRPYVVKTEPMGNKTRFRLVRK